MRIHTTHSRDAALRGLRRVNRWMLAGSVVLTGVLTDVAANAFPGKTVKTGASAKQARSAHAKHHKPAQTSTGVLRPPEQAPQASTETQQPEETQASEGAPPQESAPAEEPAPAEGSVPAQESAPAPEATPEPAPEAEAPVVSGGS